MSELFMPKKVAKKPSGNWREVVYFVSSGDHQQRHPYKRGRVTYEEDGDDREGHDGSALLDTLFRLCDGCLLLFQGQQILKLRLCQDLHFHLAKGILRHLTCLHAQSAESSRSWISA